MRCPVFSSIFLLFCVVLGGDVPHHCDQFLDERLVGLPGRAELRHLLRGAGELLWLVFS